MTKITYTALAASLINAGEAAGAAFSAEERHWLQHFIVSVPDAECTVHVHSDRIQIVAHVSEEKFKELNALVGKWGIVNGNKDQVWTHERAAPQPEQSTMNNDQSAASAQAGKTESQPFNAQEEVEALKKKLSGFEERLKKTEGTNGAPNEKKTEKSTWSSCTEWVSENKVAVGVTAVAAVALGGAAYYYLNNKQSS